MPCESLAEFLNEKTPFVAFPPRKLDPDTVPAVPKHFQREKPASSESRIFDGVQTTTPAGCAGASVPHTPESNTMNHDSFQHFASSSGMFSNFLFMAKITDNERNILEGLMPNCKTMDRFPEALMRAGCTAPRSI